MERSLKEHIQHFKDQRKAIRNSQELPSLGREAVRELLVITDVFLVSVFYQAERKWQKSHTGSLRSISLVPIGGYGRNELALHSDIDLMILCARRSDPVAEFVSEEIFYPLWDAGLEIGHSVRTITDCLDIAEKNFYTQTSFLDARCLAGNRELFKKFKKDFAEKSIEGQRKKFLENILLENQKRYQRYGEAAFLLEPNIKEGKGSLRDHHSMLWTAKALFNLSTLEEMVNAALLSPNDRTSLEQSLDFLWQIRNQLHILSDRKNDQLYFEYQEDMTRMPGFAAKAGFLEVEGLMRDFYLHASNIEYISSLFFDRILHTLKIKPHAKTAALPDRILEKDVSIYRGEIRIDRPEALIKKPYLLLKIFEYAARYGTEIHPRTGQFIRDNLYLVNDSFRSSRQTSRSMFNLMKLGSSAFKQLEVMLQTGLLALYIPEFENIRCQVQHDAYHIYTVDKHSLLTFLELSLTREEDKYPFAEIDKPEYLFLTALLHDIGKGIGHNHAEKGADLIPMIAGRMGLKEDVIRDMVFLVRHHLLLVEVATRRDLEDEKIIVECAQKIQDIKRLNMLYLLTIADARATGPRAWTAWKAALLDELYLKIKHILQQGELATPQTTARIQKALAQVKDGLTLDLKNPALLRHVENMPGDYLLIVKPHQIIKHIQLARELIDKKFALFVEARNSFWELTVLARDKPGLFAQISGVLALNDLDVLGTQIFTWGDGIAVDIFQVRELIEESVNDLKWKKVAEDLEKTLSGRLSFDHRLAEKTTPLPLQTKKHGRSSKVVIDNGISDFYTVIEVYTNDRPGLLYSLAKTLFDMGLDIRSAKISTMVDQVVDVFYVRDFYGQKIYHAEQCEEIKKALLFRLEGPKNTIKIVPFHPQ
ncbi:MAG: [protein-PII] uridylyltransferase [Thermodesulfobacteriota bacterium]